MGLVSAQASFGMLVSIYARCPSGERVDYKKKLVDSTDLGIKFLAEHWINW